VRTTWGTAGSRTTIVFVHISAAELKGDRSTQVVSSLQVARVHRRNRIAGWWVGAAVVLIVLGGAIYSLWLSKNPGSTAALPVAPPHAVVLARNSETDMMQGNFVLQTALYRTSESPVAVIHFYRTLLTGQSNQVGQFLQQGNTTMPALAPETLQHMPAIFVLNSTRDAHAANYFYTEYFANGSDVGIAVDARNPTGPTLVFMEMLTQPGS
jgi:hypothetical protein